jgi:hypothetical protein
VSDTLDPLDVLRVAVGHGLPGGELEAAASGIELVLDEDVIALANRHRVQGLLWTAVEDGVVVGDEAQVDAARRARAVALDHCQTSLATAALTLDALDGVGVQARVLKGIAIANLDHADPAERMFGDADLLIRRTDYGTALAALTSADFVRAQPAVRGWWERRFGKAIVFRAPTGGELDLHLAITGGYFGVRIDHDELWASTSEPFLLDGVAAHGLDRQGRFLHACCHAVLGGGSGLRALRDVAQLVLISDADWRSVVERSRRDGTELVIAGAIRSTWTELGLDHGHPLLQWAASYVADPAQERAFAGYTAARGQGWAPEGLSVLGALGPLDRAGFLAGLAVPSRASMRARSRTWSEHVRLGTSALRRR